VRIVWDTSGSAGDRPTTAAASAACSRPCAQTDDTYATVCVVRGAPAAANGLPAK